MKNMLSFLMLLGILSGCSTYSKQECLEMDQAQMGYKDGINGNMSFEPSVQHLQSTCGKDYDLPVDSQKIKQGWEDGVRFYCSGNGGARAGVNGLNYTGVCAKDKEKETQFFAAYNPARLGYLEARVKSLEEQITQLKYDKDSQSSQLSSCQSTVSSLESSLSSARANTCP